MVWPFQKKYPTRDKLEIRESWKVGHGEYGGKVLIARFNSGLKEIAGHPAYPYQVGIAAPLRAPNEQGLPTVEEDERLALVEGEIAKVLEDKRESILVGVLSTAGMREFVYYSTNEIVVREKFEQLRRSISSHDLQLIIQKDPAWSVYRQFIQSYG
jgi:uncharacterized protein DUF695